MKYLGGKSRHAKEIITTILNRRSGASTWVEPFIGGGSVVTAVPKCLTIMGSDINDYVVSLYKHIQSGGDIPSTVCAEEYVNVRKHPENYPDWFVGFVSIGCSFGGKEWGGYARGVGPNGPRNYALETKRNLQKMDFSGISLHACDYRDVRVPPGSVVYCDPPYAGTTGYSNSFNHEQFWQWAAQTAEIADVFVSEYSAPEGWEAVWEKPCFSGISLTGVTSTERLFTLDIAR